MLKNSLLFLMVMMLSATALAAVALPPQYVTAMDKKIAAIKDDISRKVIKTWSYDKQVAELYCHPAAVDYLKINYPQVDRIFLGMNTPGSLHLSKNRLTGNGSMRNDNQWSDITFSCEFEPATGKVKDFNLRLAGDK